MGPGVCPSAGGSIGRGVVVCGKVCFWLLDPSWAASQAAWGPREGKRLWRWLGGPASADSLPEILPSSCTAGVEEGVFSFSHYWSIISWSLLEVAEVVSEWQLWSAGSAGHDWAAARVDSWAHLKYALGFSGKFFIKGTLNETKVLTLTVWSLKDSDLNVNMTNLKCTLKWQSQKHIPNSRKLENRAEFSVGRYKDITLFWLPQAQICGWNFLYGWCEFLGGYFPRKAGCSLSSVLGVWLQYGAYQWTSFSYG